MKKIILLLAAVLSLSGFCSARAANPDKCYWKHTGLESHHFLTARLPSKVDLKMVEVGQVMGTTGKTYIDGIAEMPVYKGVLCPQTLPNLR
ncbi:hypothetical protein HKK55_21920 [Pseudomonas sp. ADAK18]|uniref:hypothetical protein n=1 Tax=Pseudomonas sp. ADAK18 TaxID=2730848 RepID=UPI0014647DAD|nr:hypothetical protein [Pseudomonas sp. ADAK18]QJI31245.1 hypothetical protein HKK55_21920 [Pseudomonas sp. ADAK18]